MAHVGGAGYCLSFFLVHGSLGMRLMAMIYSQFQLL